MYWVLRILCEFYPFGQYSVANEVLVLKKGSRVVVLVVLEYPTRYC